MHKPNSGMFGLFIICAVLIWLVSRAAWSFLEASWPTWGFLLLALVLFAAVRSKKKNLFLKATKTIIRPIILGLCALMALELLFGIFRIFFNEERVGHVEDAILKAHFALLSVENQLGYTIPLAVAVAVVFLCLTVGDWKYSTGLSKIKDSFSFVSVAFLIMASFTFFRGSAANTLLDWEKADNQRWYKMALAQEERSTARIIATRQLTKPLTQLDGDSKKNFQTFFSQLKGICDHSRCLTKRFDLDWDRPTASAFRETIRQKVSEDYRQLVPRKKTPPNQFGPLDRLSAAEDIDAIPMWIDRIQPADIDLAVSKSPQEMLLARRASSQLEREKQKQAIEQRQARASEIAKGEKEEKGKTTEAFASALAAAVPGMEGLIGAYVDELVDAAAEWIVRPLVNQLFKQGHRPDTLQDLQADSWGLPATVVENFDKFHSVGTQRSERSEFGAGGFVESFFAERKAANVKRVQEETRKMEEMKAKETESHAE